ASLGHYRDTPPPNLPLEGGGWEGVIMRRVTSLHRQDGALLGDGDELGVGAGLEDAGKRAVREEGAGGASGLILVGAAEIGAQAKRCRNAFGGHVVGDGKAIGAAGEHELIGD